MLLTRHMLRAGTLVFMAASLLASCRSATETPAPSPIANTPAPTAIPSPTPSPTPPPRTLTVCLGQEPLTLYPYGRASQTMWSVLEAVYDGPIDQAGYGAQPVILEKLPSLADGDAKIQPIEVKPGDEIIDAAGNLTTLAQGARIRPTGCTSDACAIPYDGTSPLQMDQMVANFKLKAGLTWSDGQPLTSADSVYSFNLAADPDTPVSKYNTDRTAAYTALDSQTVQWTGKPGFINPGYATIFWMPLPEHAWGQKKAADLVNDPAAAEKPIGWGPYVIDEWVKGDHISLHKNPGYFRASEGLPKFDVLTFRFLSDNGSASLMALTTGECDVVDRTAGLDSQLEALAAQQQAGKLREAAVAGPEWEHLDFGIKPASYDDGYNQLAGDRPDFFSDPRVRQAFAYCLDRQSIADQLFLELSSVPNSFVPPDDPAYDKQVKSYPYDPAEGARLLEAVGWLDTDKDPATPRQAQGVAGVTMGAPLEVTLQTTQATLRQKTADLVAKSLSGCGIGVKVQRLTPGELFAEGTAGPLFGRHFDLAEFTWEAGTLPQCFLFSTDRIPTPANHWVGVNITGYSNPAYDAACAAALETLPGQTGGQEALNQAQEIFANELPVIPLYLNVQVAATRPDFCGLKMDPTARSEMWNIEAFDDGEGCPE